MSQATPTIGANQSGLAYRTADNDAKAAIITNHSGSSAPSYVTAGMHWLDTSATPWLLKMYDGTDHIVIGAVNASTNTFTPYYGAAEPRYINHATDTGSANAYAIAPSPAITAYVTGQIFTLKPANANTTSSTLAVNGLTAKNIKTLDGANPAAGAIATTAVHILMYDGTNMVLLNPAIIPVASGGTGATTASGARTALGCGTAATKNTGTSGTNVPLCDNASTAWSGYATWSQSATNSPITCQYNDDGSGVGPLFVSYRNSASPAANDTIGGLSMRGNSDSQSREFARVYSDMPTVADATRSGRILFLTTQSGTAADRGYFGAGFVVGSPTGGDKGTGTINATAVYDDNVLLTCYVIEAFKTGKVDVDYWDQFAIDRVHPVYEEVQREVDVEGIDADGKPVISKQIVTESVKVGEEIETRTHFGARKFASRLGTETDPLDLDKYWKHFSDKGHLTSMPNRAKFNPENGITVGDMIQRLWETVEIQAVHIHKLNERLKELES